MSRGIIDTIIGGLEVAAGIILEFVPGGEVFGAMLIAAGAGMLLIGIGTLLSGSNLGVVQASRNPIEPWRIIYGRARVGGTVVYLNEFGSSNKWLDMVIVLAAHQCQSVDYLFFDSQRVSIGDNNTSYNPVEQTANITSIARSNNVVTVTIDTDIPSLLDGDDVFIQNVSGPDQTVNGRFPVTIITHSPVLTFTYLSGGEPMSETSGQVKTAWADYGNTVYMEAMLGTQTLGETFVGMTDGTPNGGDPTDLVTPPNGNPWSAACSCLGKTVVFLRMQYDSNYYSGGIPQISFLMHGKNDIVDPRTSPPAIGYTENAALCIADYLCQPKWGFKAVMGTDVPYAPLIAAANICDQAVTLAATGAGTEPRYTCNGTFTLSLKRGNVLQNMLTSCGGRLTYVGGKFVIWPASYAGVSATLTSAFLHSNSAAGFRWKPSVSIRDLYNGVKGTYVSPTYKWGPADFPAYCQDADHGYDNGAPEYNYDANLTADGGDRRWKDVQLPFTTSPATAQRLAKIELLRSRFMGTGTFPLNMAGYQFVPMDVIQVSLDVFGWDNQLLEVMAARLKLDNQQSGDTAVPLLGTEIDVQQTDPSIYAWDIGEEQSAAGYVQAIVPDNRTPAPPTDFAANTSGELAIVLTWDAPTDAYVLNGGHLELRYQEVASPPGIWISLGNADPSSTQLNITAAALVPLASYIFEIRSVNAAGVPSAWISVTATAPESLVPNIAAILSIEQQYLSDGSLQVTIAWQPPADPGNFEGVHVYVESPDQSAGPVLPLDGSTNMTGLTTLGGQWAPADVGKFTTNPVILNLSPASAPITNRYYLTSFSALIENPVVRANEPDPTPSATITLEPPSSVSGEEFARLVTNVTASVSYDDTTVAAPTYSITVNWTNPTDPPSAKQNPFGGVVLWLDFYQETPDRRAQATALIGQGQTTYTIGPFPLYAGTASFNIYVLSGDNAAVPNVNSLVIGLTPYATVTESWPLQSRIISMKGTYANDPTNFAVGNARYFLTGAGQQVLELDASWTPPSDVRDLARYGGSIVCLQRVGIDSSPVIVAPLTKAGFYTMTFPNFPQATQTWNFWLVSADNNGNFNASPSAPTGEPTVSISVSPPAVGTAGQEYSNFVALSFDGVGAIQNADSTWQQFIYAYWTPPADPRFGQVEIRIYTSGGALVAKNDSSASPIQVNIPNPVGVVNYTMKLVSIDVNGRANNETSSTPQTTLAVGSVSGSIANLNIIDASIAKIINIDASQINTNLMTAVNIKVTNLAGSGIVTDLTQQYDFTGGTPVGVSVHNNLTGPGTAYARLIISSVKLMIVDSYNAIKVELLDSSGGLIAVNDNSGLQGVSLSGPLYFAEIGNSSNNGKLILHLNGSLRYVLGYPTAGKLEDEGTGTFSSGTALISTVLSSIDNVQITVLSSGAYEGGCWTGAVGGQFSAKSSSGSSTSQFSWRAIGNP